MIKTKSRVMQRFMVTSSYERAPILDVSLVGAVAVVWQSFVLILPVSLWERELRILITCCATESRPRWPFPVPAVSSRRTT